MSTHNLPMGLAFMPQSVRFLFAGGFAAFVTWLVRFPLSHVMPFALAVAVANVIGMAIGFVTYRHLVFPGSNKHVGHQLRDFVIVNLCSTVVVIGVSVLLADYVFPLVGFAWHVEAVAHAAGIAVGAVSNFFGHRHLSFARN